MAKVNASILMPLSPLRMRWGGACRPTFRSAPVPQPWYARLSRNQNRDLAEGQMAPEDCAHGPPQFGPELPRVQSPMDGAVRR